MFYLQELCDLLNKVEVACLGSGRAIKCNSKKVGDHPQFGVPKEKSLRCKDKKRSVIGKVSAAV
jgi:hypothetical protein